MLEPESAITLSHVPFIFTLKTGCLASLCLGLCVLTLKMLYTSSSLLLLRFLMSWRRPLVFWRSESLRFFFTLANGLEVVQFTTVVTILAVGMAVGMIRRSFYIFGLTMAWGPSSLRLNFTVQFDTLDCFCLVLRC